LRAQGKLFFGVADLIQDLLIGAGATHEKYKNA
jgi:hypothetical protein